MIDFPKTLNTQEVEAFSAGLAKFEPDELADLIHQGPGAASIKTAASAWKSLAEKLGELASTYEKKISSLQWTASSAQEMTATTMCYPKWMRETANAASHLGLKMSQAAEVFEAMHRRLVPAATFRDYRDSLQRLRLNNSYGRNNTTIFETEEKYQEKKDENIAALLWYRYQAETCSTFPNFKKAPAFPKENVSQQI